MANDQVSRGRSIYARSFMHLSAVPLCLFMQAIYAIRSKEVILGIDSILSQESYVKTVVSRVCNYCRLISWLFCNSMFMYRIIINIILQCILRIPIDMALTTEKSSLPSNSRDQWTERARKRALELRMSSARMWRICKRRALPLHFP